MDKFNLIKSFHFLLNEALNGNYFTRIGLLTFPLSKKIVLEKSHFEAIKKISEIKEQTFRTRTNKDILKLLIEIICELKNNEWRGDSVVNF